MDSLLLWLKTIFKRRPSTTDIYAKVLEQPANEPIVKTGSSQYLMTFDEFRQLIPTLLIKYPFCTFEITEADFALIWQSTSNDQREAYQARDDLRWRHNDATLDVARQLRHNYEMLRRAKENGNTKAKISARAGCSCMEGLAEHFTSLDEIIAAFEGKESSAPVIPPHELPCCFDQDVQTPCACWTTGITEWTLGEVGSPDSEDPPLVHIGYEILGELKNFVESRPTIDPLPDSWKQTLLQNSATRIGNRIKQLMGYRDREIVKIETTDSSGSAPTTQDNINALTDSLQMKDLRAMQKKYGLHGHRTKTDVAEQIVSTDAAKEEIADIFAKQKTSSAEYMRESITEADSDIESLTEQMRGIWQRLGMPKDSSKIT